MIERIKLYLQCILLACGCIFFGALTWVVLEIKPHAVRAVDKVTESAGAAALTIEDADRTINMMRCRLSALLSRADTQLADVRADVSAIAKPLEGLAGIGSDLRPILNHINETARRAEEAAGELQPLLGSAAHIAGQLENALPEMTSSVNATLAAVAAAAPATSLAVEHVAEAAEKLAPSILQSVNRITRDTSVLTRQVVRRPVPWYLRWLGFGRK